MSRERAKLIVEAAKRHEHFQMMEDGYQWFCPNDGMAFDSFSLRAIADGLDRINKPWDDQVKKEIQAMPDTMQRSIAAQIEEGGLPRTD